MLHQFGSKDALIIGLLNQLMGMLGDELNVLAEGFETSHAAFALSYLDYVREPSKTAIGTAASILAAVVDSDLLDSTRATFEC